MKCNKAEKLILLQDSGELIAKYSGTLSVHLHDCASCRRFQYALIESQTVFQAQEEPSATVMNAIYREARRLTPETKRAKILSWKPVLAMAASIVIALGFFFRLDPVELVLTMTETELMDTQDQIISVMHDGLSEDDRAFDFLMTYVEEN